MRYASIRSLDISNGEGVGVALFVQGCDFHCKDCFNIETWSFNGGKEYTKETENKIVELCNRKFINRLSILGGEPLHKNNRKDILSLLAYIKARYPQKTIWLYTGYTWEELDRDNISGSVINTILHNTDVLIDGRYEDDKRDITLKWRGSSNQRVIDVKKSLEKGELILYET